MPLDPCLSSYGLQAVVAVVGGHGMVVSRLFSCLSPNVSLIYPFDSLQYTRPLHTVYRQIGGAPCQPNICLIFYRLSRDLVAMHVRGATIC